MPGLTSSSWAGTSRSLGMWSAPSRSSFPASGRTSTCSGSTSSSLARQIRGGSPNSSIPLRGRPAALIAILLISIASMAPAVHGEQRTRYIYTSTFIFENRGSSPYNLTEADATITLFMNDTWQTVRILNSTPPITRSYYDEDGNSLAILNFSSKIPPNSKLEFSVSYDMQVSSRSKPALDIAKAGVLADVPDELANKWTNKTVTFTMGDRAIKELAEGLTKNQTTVLGKVLNLLGWFEDHVSANSAETPRYPNETLSGGK